MSVNSERVKDVLDHQIALDSADEEWADFAEHIILSLELGQRYRHSLGRYSRFFRELAAGRFFGTRCASCVLVYTPPRTICPQCQAVTRWQELTGAGALETYSLLYFTAGIGADLSNVATPVLLAYVLLDGSDTLFPHLLHCPPERAARGLRVRVAYRREPVSHPLHLMHFVPDDEEE